MGANFRKELQELINRHSLERDSNSPDFVLALFMEQCLEAFNYGVCARDSWYGISPKPGLAAPAEGKMK